MDLEDVMARQGGVITRAQVLAAGLDDDHIETRLRRKDWRRVHRGVYVGHTGPLGWEQQVWAALLFYGEADGEAAAFGSTALALEGMSGHTPGGQVHVAVPHERRVTKLPGVVVHRLRSFHDVVHPSRRPRRVRLEHAVVHVASAARDEAAAVAVLADACQTRRTTATRLGRTLLALGTMPRRRLLLAILDDVATGVHSVLERRYARDVERAHGLPRGKRQQAGGNGRGGRAWRDCLYLRGRLVVELDGRLGHEWTEDRWADFDRDIEAAVEGAVTIRVGWRQVLDPCRVAAALARLLQGLGWTGTPRPCGPACAVGLAKAA